MSYFHVYLFYHLILNKKYSLYYNKKIIIQNEINPDNIVKIKFLESMPIKKAIDIAITLGSFISTSIPCWFKKTAGNIIAGKTADGTYDKTCFVLL